MKKVINSIYIGAENKKSLFDISIPNNWNNKLVIFIHGYMGYKDWGCWELVQEYFNNYKFGFLKYNVSHNGGTITNPIDFDDLESFSKNSYTKEIEDFDSIIRLIKDKFKLLPEIYIIGHSRGGGIALLQSSNEYVSKIVSWAGISSISDRFPKGKKLKKWKENGVYYQMNSRTLQNMPHKYSLFIDFTNNKDILNIKKYCKNSKIPTLVIHGENDTSVDLSEGENIAKWLNTKLIKIRGAQHTFGSTQPWKTRKLPNHLKEVCEQTKNFLEK